MRLIQSLIAMSVAASAACSGDPPPKLPPNSPNCEVTVYRGALPEDVTVTELGTVVVSCSKNDADSDCIRALQDEACKLGGNVVYEVPNMPERESDTMLRYVAIAGKKK